MIDFPTTFLLLSLRTEGSATRSCDTFQGPGIMGSDVRKERHIRMGGRI